MNGLKQTTIRLPPELHKRLKMLAINKDTTITKLLEEAITEKLKREETK